MSDAPGEDEALSDPLARSERGPRLRFPKAARLTRAREFQQVKEQGRSFPGRLLVLGWLVRTDAKVADLDSRVGLVTSRRVGGAVVRNAVRRHLREAVRHTRPQLRAGCWIVLIARHHAARASGAELAEEWLKLARRAGILLPSPGAASPPPNVP